MHGLLQARAGLTSIRRKKNRHNLTDTEKKEYIDAELCLINSAPKDGLQYAQNRYDEVVYIHLIQSNFIHRVGAFLPWHRYYMKTHEELLRNECNYVRDTR